VYLYEGRPIEIQTPTRWNPIGHCIATPQLVIAQQYSSAIFVAWRFRSQNEKYGAISKKKLRQSRVRKMTKSH
jgi:hypothetical protein